MIKKKVVFCIHKMSPFYEVVKEALINIGFEVYLFDYYQSNLKIRLMGLINNVYKFDDKRTIINQEINLALLETIRKNKPDYLLMIKGLHISNETINKIKKEEIVTINWFQDLLEFMPWLKKHGYVYDFLFTPDPLMVRELKKNKINSYYLPLATQSDPQPNSTTKKYGIVFSGQYTKRREKFFEKLSVLGEQFIIWGYPGWAKSKLGKHYQGLLPSVNSMLGKFRESKIVINVQTAEDKYPSEVVSLRAFEATGVGSCLLNWKHKGIDEFWKDKEEIVNFISSQDTLEKARYYLTHDKEREKIALSGWRRTHREHNYQNRLREMFKVVKNYS